jgi:PAS domain S-box-containing protein
MKQEAEGTVAEKQQDKASRVEPKRIVDSLQNEIEGRRMVEEDLCKNGLYYRAIVEDQTELICRFLPDGTITFANDACHRFFGLLHEGLIGYSFLSLVPIEERSRLEDEIRSLSHKRNLRTFEHRVQSAKGLRWVQWTTRAIFDKAGHIIEFQSVGRDINERKIAEEERDLLLEQIELRRKESERLAEDLKRERDILSTIMGNSDACLAYLDPHFNLLRVNSTYARVTGFNKEDLVGKNHFDLFPHQEHRFAFQRAVETGEPIKFFSMPLKIGDSPRNIYWDLSLAPVKDFKGIVQGLVLSAIDVTERIKINDDLQSAQIDMEQKIEERSADIVEINRALEAEIADRERAEEELSLERKRFQILTENSPFGMALIGKDGTFRYINPKFQELFGYDQSEIRYGRDWFRKAYPDTAYRHKVIEAWIADARSLCSGEKRPRSFSVRCKNGEVKVVRFILVKLNGEESLITCEDISERKQFLNELRIAHQQLQDIIEFLPDSTFVIDKDKKVIAWNRAIEEMTGVKKQEILGKGNYAYGIPFYGKPRPILIDLISECNEEIEACYKYLERKGYTVYGETSTTNLPGGKKAILWAKASPLLDNGGNIVGAVESIRDITERKISEEALEEANVKLNALIQASPLAILTFDPEGRVQSWNTAAERIFGWKEEEVLGLQPPIIPDDRRHEFRALIEINLQGRMFTGVELQRKKKNGSLIDISLSSAPIRDSLGRIRGIVSVMDDITKRKAAERSLRESLHFLQRLIDTIPNPIFYQDTNGRFQGYNQAFERFVDLSRGEIIGKTAYDIYPKEQADWLKASDSDLLNKPGILVKETTMRLVDGQRVDVIFNRATYANEDETLAGLVGVIIDITDRKRAEAELKRAKEAAEEAARIKADFLANMSHEIRTPLNAVIGMAGLLLDAALSPEHQDCVETIRSSGDTLLAIINDILDFSKIDGGNMELERHPFDLRSCIEESMDLSAARAAEKGLNLAYEIDDHTPEMIIGDLTRLRQVFVNLISNAVKFTEEGEVFVSVDSRHLKERDYEFHFGIKDTGIGISSDHMNRLFKSFSQIDASTTRKYGGTGLGLAISKRLVELMGGNIWAESEVGMGSIFHFTIVAQARPAEPKAFQNPDQPILEGKRVLIVDGRDTNLKIMKQLAISWHMLPGTAANAKDAVDLARSNAFDVAILSIEVQGMNLPTLVSEIRKYQREMPIILNSSFGSKKIDECKQFNAFLSRPIKPSSLYESLGRIFDNEAIVERSSLSPQHEHDNVHKLRILLAEDNVINQKVALRMLKKIGYRADLAANGLEVLQALERLHYDVVLMDVQMPEMDGLEATRAIRKRLPPEDQPRIIAITAYALEGDREKCLKAGMDGYISKPVNVNELEDALGMCRCHSSSEISRSIDIQSETRDAP